MSNPYIFSDTGEKLNAIVNDLTNVLHWASTVEGHQYWAQVIHKLKDHAQMARLQVGNSGPAPTGAYRTPATPKGVQETLLQTYHIKDKDGYLLCGLTLGAKPPKGHSVVSIKEKNKGTCALCKSKLLTH